MIFPADKGWYFEDEDEFVHGPFESREVAQEEYRKWLEKQYERPS